MTPFKRRRLQKLFIPRYRSRAHKYIFVYSKINFEFNFGPESKIKWSLDVSSIRGGSNFFRVWRFFGLNCLNIAEASLWKFYGMLYINCESFHNSNHVESYWVWLMMHLWKKSFKIVLLDQRIWYNYEFSYGFIWRI